MADYQLVRVLRLCSANAVLALRLSSSASSSLQNQRIRIALDWMNAPETEAARAHLAALLGLPDAAPSSSSSSSATDEDALAIAPGDARFTQHSYSAELRCYVGLLWRHDTGNVSEAMVRDGYARALLSSLPSAKVRAFYARLEEEARTQRRGLWAGDTMAALHGDGDYGKESACDVCGRRPRALVHEETLTQCCSEECARQWCVTRETR